MMKLKFNFRIDDLYNRDSLIKLDNLFLDYLKNIAPDLVSDLLYYRSLKFEPKTPKFSNFLIDLGIYCEDFIADFFDVTDSNLEYRQSSHKFSNIHFCKRNFVQRRVIKKYKFTDLANLDIGKISQKLETYIGNISEVNFANYVTDWMKDAEKFHAQLECAEQYAAFMYYNNSGLLLFSAPQRIDYDNLIDLEIEYDQDIKKFYRKELKNRYGFNCTSEPIRDLEIADQVNYCIYCHNLAKDSCSKGFVQQKDNGKVQYKQSWSGEDLAGCPLEQKISEMNKLRSGGYSIASLAMAVVDNPMLAATGHRICNDCMKSCIYQKQDPVDIPKIESKVLREVLNLPYGFEIYSLLTRWNPLNVRYPYPKALTGYKILVAGQGPAGFTLAHYLLNEGHEVVAIDGLKIEPLPAKLTGRKFGESSAIDYSVIEHIKDINAILSPLGERIIGGFGGVAEYGITSRWDKNNLTIIRIILERRSNYHLFGGVRLGSNITPEQVKELGFDHVALCLGAGKPYMPKVKNLMAKGVKMASDFLMNLQLSGAHKLESLANLTIRMPIAVIGGGLTAIDTATEALAYYPLQVEKFLNNYEALVEKYGFKTTQANWSEEEALIAQEFLAHAQIIRREKEKAKKESRPPEITKLLQEWGGATIYYRNHLSKSPSYRLNHEEIAYALSEGVKFAENMIPVEVITDKYGYASQMLIRDGQNKKHLVGAHTILLATGTSPNNMIAYEFPEFVPSDMLALSNKDVIINQSQDFSMSFYGDLNPSYSGNVVKAMASAKQGFSEVTQALQEQTSPKSHFSLVEIYDKLQARILEVNILGPKIVELIIRSPLAVENFQPGQFYRLQNYDIEESVRGSHKNLLMEPLALTGSYVNKAQGTISLIILEMGGSSNLCRNLRIGEKVILMGPTGSPTYIYRNKHILLAGGGLGNAVLFSIGKAMRQAGCKVVYFAGYRKSEDCFKKDYIEQAADRVVWCSEEGEIIPGRKQDLFIAGNIIEAMQQYGAKFTDQDLSLAQIDHMVVIGSDKMMQAVYKAKNTLLANYLAKDPQMIVSVNSPMQCMMKEICAQCLQRHYDVRTGEEYFVFSCTKQDQDACYVDFENLAQRLGQNSLMEKTIHPLVSENKN